VERIECRVTGRVQGVFYRDFARIFAGDIGVTGYATNLPDGSVRVVAEGERKKLVRFIAILQKGSPHSRVANVEAKWSSGTGEFSSFFNRDEI